MCIIIDANLAALVFSDTPSTDFVPIINWLTSSQKDGKLVVGGHLAKELDKVNSARRFVGSLVRAGRARIIPSDVTDVETENIRAVCLSNDPHVIALARLSGARVLCSHDKNLHRDFTDTNLVPIPQGHIYQNATHAHLLRIYGHTSACKQAINKDKKQVQP